MITNSYQSIFYDSMIEVVDEFCIGLLILLAIRFIYQAGAYSMRIIAFRRRLNAFKQRASHLTTGDDLGTLLSEGPRQKNFSSSFFDALVLRLSDIFQGYLALPDKGVLRSQLQSLQKEAHDHFAGSNIFSLIFHTTAVIFLLAWVALTASHYNSLPLETKLFAAGLLLVLAGFLIIYVVRERNGNRVIDDIQYLESLYADFFNQTI